jgi:hypothetical protein
MKTVPCFTPTFPGIGPTDELNERQEISLLLFLKSRERKSCNECVLALIVFFLVYRRGLVRNADNNRMV